MHLKNKDLPQRKAVCTFKFITGYSLPIVPQESDKTRLNSFNNMCILMSV